MRQIWIIWLLLVPALNASAGTLVQFRTTFGVIEVELFDQDKPVTVQNFIRYVQSGLYQNMFLHRCIPGFVIQGGGFWIDNPLSTAPFAPTNQNLLVVPTFSPITNEFNVGRRLTNSFGTIAMAKVGGDPNSATSQWFFNLGNNTNLDVQNGGFTVFGRVVRGTNVLNLVNTLNKGLAYGLVDLTWWWETNSSFGQTFSDLPVIYSGPLPTPKYPTYADLVYVFDISLLSVQVQTLSNHTHQVSWNSVTGLTNYVEFTTNLPPVWRTLVATNGTGSQLQVVDATANPLRRFYRVRVNY